MTIYFLLSLLIVITLGYFASKRYVALALAFLFIPVGYGALADLLGKPKPVSLEWAHGSVKEALILGSVIREDVGIFVYMAVPGALDPMSFKFPWDKQAAEQLQKAERESEKNGQKGAKVMLPFEPSLDNGVARFYPIPQVAMPPKAPPQKEKPHVVERAA